ncbi:MAG: DUF4835 family protein [Candidatus Marinimicrobia bacterium]|nr:DUF4835 family protein [Candidatus Neomarinimicrobiota bacterium]
MKKISIIIIAILFSISVLFSQTLIPKVTSEAKSVKQTYLSDIDNLRNSIEQYIKSNSFSNNLYDINYPITVKLFINNIDESGNEYKYVCKAVFTNDYDLRFFDEGWTFPYNTDISSMRSGIYNPVTSVIDFYGYLVVASELDAITLMGGDAIYEKARNVMELGNMSQWPQGCNSRIQKISEISENYRLRKARYYYTLATWDAEDGELNSSVENLKKSLGFIKEILTIQKKDKYTRIFIDNHYKESKWFVETLQDTSFLPDFRNVAPEHHKYFEKISSNFGE